MLRTAREMNVVDRSAILRLKLVILISAALLSTEAGAQTGNRIPSVIQLPSFSQISYSGTVQVPVSGANFRRGFRRSAGSSSRRRWNRGARLTTSQTLGGARIADRTSEGKSLVRFARRQYKQGDKSGAYQAYQMAIEVLDGRLRQLAIAEFRRLY